MDLWLSKFGFSCYFLYRKNVGIRDGKVDIYTFGFAYMHCKRQCVRKLDYFCLHMQCMSRSNC